MSLRDIERRHVLRAIRDCLDAGDAEFLSVHGFKPANRFLLHHNGRFYQSKAIVGVAHGYATDTTWGPRDFSGGTATVQRTLERLGFEVVVAPYDPWPEELGLEERIHVIGSRFSKWSSWVGRESTSDLSYPGVYVISLGGPEAPRKVLPFAERIVYIGQTTRSLRQRLQEFEDSALGRSGHSGGVTFRARSLARSLRSVNVATLAVRLPRDEQNAAITLLESTLIWAYVRRWGRQPVCNTK